jgi:hypothetical protein
MSYFGRPIGLALAVALSTVIAAAALLRDHSAGASQAVAASGAAVEPAILSIGTPVVAKLLNDLDSGTCKPGDRVEAEVTRDVSQNHKVVLKAGARVIGHVVALDASSAHKAETRMAISFKSVSMKSGEQAQISFVIQALAIAPRLKKRETRFKVIDQWRPPLLLQPRPAVASGGRSPKESFDRRIQACTGLRGSPSP